MKEKRLLFEWSDFYIHFKLLSQNSPVVHAVEDKNINPLTVQTRNHFC